MTAELDPAPGREADLRDAFLDGMAWAYGRSRISVDQSRDQAAAEYARSKVGAQMSNAPRDAEFVALREALARRIEEHGLLHPVVVAADAWRDDPCKGLGSHKGADLAAAVDFYRAQRRIVPALDRAARAITGQSAAELPEQLKPAMPSALSSRDQELLSILLDDVVAFGIGDDIDRQDDGVRNEAIALIKRIKLAGAVTPIPRDDHCSATGGGCELHPRGCPAPELKPATSAIGPANTELIERALDHYTRTMALPRVDREAIARLRAQLTGPAPGHDDGATS